jgi:hypothetical protein
MTHRQLCDWAAQLATSFGQDPNVEDWERLAGESRKAGETEMARIGDEVSTAIRALEFDRVTAVFQKDLPAECL